MKILVVEDDYAFQILIQGIIQMVLGCFVVVEIVEDVENAVKVLDKKFDLVISDFNYPGGGFPALQSHVKDLDYIVVSSGEAKNVDPSKFVSKSNLVHGLSDKLKINKLM